MSARTRWKVLEKHCSRAGAEEVAREAVRRGAAGAVTSWGSGVDHRETIRIFWEDRGHSLEKMDEDELTAAEDLVEEDWGQYWRGSLTSFTAGDRFTLVPAWDPPPKDEKTSPIFIDPGMAFGAGDHPTTRICVRMMEDIAGKAPGTSPVLDIGTGTGVLAMAAALLGLAPVDALDIDPFCYSSCRRNVARNGLQGMVRPLLLSLDLVRGTYPLALANVAPRQIESMAPVIARKVSENGLLLLSGFGVDAEERVMRSLSADFRMIDRNDEDGWLGILAERGRN